MQTYQRIEGGVFALLVLLAPACQPRPAVAPAPIEPSRVARFEGQVQLPNGVQLDYSVILAPDPRSPDEYLGTIDVPRQALFGASLEAIRFRPREQVVFELALPGAPRWTGHFNADGSIACQFTQGEVARPCSMRELVERPVSPPAPAHRRQTPLPPFAYAMRDVRVENPSAHLMLAGTLTVPNGAGPHPALVLVSDAGTQDRDATRFGHKPFLVLADHLTKAGIAVLRVDDRGAGAWGEAEPDQDLAELESDVRAGLAFARAQPEIDSRRVGLLGHGLGAVLAARIARGAQEVAFVVLLAPDALASSARLAPGDPASVFSQLTCPVLALTGERDTELADPVRNEVALRDELGKSSVAVLETLQGLNHWFQHAETGDRADDPSLEETFAPEALERISSWLGSRTWR